jgi:hypothetical protein
MSCYRFDLHRKYSLYLHELLPPASMKKIEDHLLNCQSCIRQLEKLKAVQKLIKDLPRVSPAKDVWPSIENGLSQNAPVYTAAAPWKKIAIVTIFGLISGLFGAAVYVKVSDHENFLEASIHPSEFKPVSISHMADTVEPHVVTEGYVTEANIHEEDGDRVFKLVEDPNHSGPFVICEVIDTLNMPVPPVGSRVRVYGVSRYDGKSDHQWHEVHPVLNIQMLKN